MRVVGYARLSKASTGHSLDAQRAAIERWAKANGHDLVTVVAEVGSARTGARLPGLRLAIAAVTAGMGEAVVCRDLDRVTRSTLDGARLLEDAKDNGWRLLGAVDGIDTADPEQRIILDIRIALAQEERRKLGRRTSEGLAAARRAGSRVGKPRQVNPAVEARIVRLARRGATPYAIAKRLTTEGVPTPQGGKAWSPSVVRDVIKRNPTKARAAA